MDMGQILLDGVSYLPDQFPLVLVYSGCGMVGSVTAGCAKFISPFPSLSELVLRGVFGAGAGFIAGAACLAKFGFEPSAVWWSMAACGGLGLLGPTFVIELAKSWLAKKVNP